MQKRLYYTAFLLVLAAGYLAALANLFLTHERDDLKPGLSIADIAANFHGSPFVTRLTVMINGSMRKFLGSDEEKARIESWLEAGAARAPYETDVRPILQARCVKCHDMFGEAAFRPLTSYEEVMTVARPAEGKSWQQIARLSHQHLFGMSFIVFCAGLVLLRNRNRMSLKVLLAVAGFAGILLDVAGWSMTKLSASFAWMPIAGNSLHSAAFAAMLLVSLHELWIRPIPDGE